MATRSSHKLVGRLKQTQYGVLKSLTDVQNLDAATLEDIVRTVVSDRFALARGFLDAARILERSGDPLVRRSAVSRAYYGVYHAARGTVFAIRRHIVFDRH